MGHDRPQSSALVAMVVALCIVAVIIIARGDCAPPAAKSGFANWENNLAHGYPYNYAAAGPEEVELNRMYSTAEVDPLVTGQLYAGARASGTGRRWIYGGRTSHGDKWGLHEFSTGVPGQAGVDVGLLGLREYSLDGRPDVFDDGIPENWRLPSTPVNWYVPVARDHYDVEAQQAAVYDENLMSLQEPDHDPLLN